MAVRGTEAYDYNQLNRNTNHRATGNSSNVRQIPRVAPNPQPRPKVIRKTRAQLKAETRRANLKAIALQLPLFYLLWDYQYLAEFS